MPLRIANPGRLKLASQWAATSSWSTPLPPAGGANFCSNPPERAASNFRSDGPGEKENPGSNKRWHFMAGGFILGVAGGAAAYSTRKKGMLTAEAITSSAGDRIEGLKNYKMTEVAEHDCVEKRVWVTFRSGVYDITEFIPLHPGAEKLMMAAGGCVEPFWHMYAVHLEKPYIRDMLEKYRIGNLEAQDVLEQRQAMKDSADPFGNEPLRHHALVVNSGKPFNAETPLAILGDAFITPTELFYIRNHLPVPDIDEKDYELEIHGVGVQNKVLRLSDLKAFPKHTIEATIQCTGNRRLEMKRKKNLKGLDWKGGAIGNAQWAGAKLSDVLAAAGFNEEESENARHVIFEGLDVDPANLPYEASIPIEKANDPKGDVLLAYEMNGEPLTRDHGYPVRVIVPGVAAARDIKWLGRVIVSETESASHWQQMDYKPFNPSVDWDNVDFSTAEPIQELPVTSAICEPHCGSSVGPGEVAVSGYAWSGGGRKIIRVDLTGDGGKTWTQAHTLVQSSARHPRHWGWTLWKGKVAVPEGCSSMEVWSKAVDSSCNVQPETFENIWNLRGVLSNAYCRISLTVDRSNK